MSMTWGDLKEMLVDLGFEEDSITSESEYGRLIRNSVNRAVSIIRSTVILQIADYLRYEESWGYETTEEDSNGTERNKWVLPKTKRITAETEDTQKINFPEILEPLLPLLSAHYIWLDDDLSKATLYWNEYDDMKNQIVAVAKTPRRALIEGGF